jgi:type IV pilus assembly protein PilV
MKNLMRNRRGQNGFTLLEMLVAVTILAIGLLAVVSMQAVATKSNLYSNRTSVGAALAQQVAEDILSWDIVDSRVTTTTGGDYLFLTDPATNAFLPQITIPGAGAYTATYQTAPNVGQPGNTRVDVTVKYIGDAGPVSVANYTTYKRIN